MKKIIGLMLAVCAVTTSMDSLASNINDNDFGDNDKPRLIVEIVASGVRYDQMLRFRSNLIDSGLNLLMKEGSVFTNARNSYMYTSPICGAASIATGSLPSGHGIVGNEWVNYTTNKQIEALKNSKFRGVGCNEDEGQFSPETLAASTLADEIRGITPRSKIYSLAIDYSDAIIHGGYNPDGCYWLDTRYGVFVTSSYYHSQLPWWVTQFNEADKKWNYLNELWKVEKNYKKYVYQNATSIITSAGVTFSFDMLFKPKNNEFKRLKETPMGNSYLVDFAIETIKADSLGQDNITDLLVLNMTTGRDVSRIYGSSSTEAEDSYYKLDKDISRIISFLDDNVGRDNYMLVFTSSHGMSDKVTKVEASNQGKFNAMQFKVLMGGFLNAQLGSDNWVTTYSNRQIYLNRRLIYEKGLSLVDIQNSIATFALQFAGVSHAITSTTLQTNYYGKGVLHKMQNSFFPRHGGDLMINLLPGWIEIEDENDVVTLSSWGSPYEYDSHVPMIFLGKSIEPRVVHTPVDIIDIAPTISEMIGVPYPNASEGNVISEIIISK
ncbi:MAG: alkaline phosphatase family protein [Rikenellaceae bacterium]